MDFNALVARIKQHEGFRAGPYPDAGGWAIGYGRNLTFNPLSEDEAESLLLTDLMCVISELSRRVAF